MLLEMGPIIYACCTDNIRGEALYRSPTYTGCCLHPANALALESFLQYAGKRGGREPSAKENMF